MWVDTNLTVNQEFQKILSLSTYVTQVSLKYRVITNKFGELQ